VPINYLSSKTLLAN